MCFTGSLKLFSQISTITRFLTYYCLYFDTNHTMSRVWPTTDVFSMSASTHNSNSMTGSGSIPIGSLIEDIHNVQFPGYNQWDSNTNMTRPQNPTTIPDSYVDSGSLINSSTHFTDTQRANNPEPSSFDIQQPEDNDEEEMFAFD
ncbi:hypothetical protein PCE1_000483 [Barthelona sp. PCE]